MYQVDELIDHIRQLESQTGKVYILLINWVNCDGESYPYIHDARKDIHSIDISAAVKNVLKECYDEYCDSLQSCCGGGDSGCCEEYSLDEFLRTYTGYTINPDERFMEKAQKSQETSYKIYAGSFRCDHCESYGEMYLVAVNPR